MEWKHIAQQMANDSKSGICQVLERREGKYGLWYFEIVARVGLNVTEFTRSN